MYIKTKLLSIFIISSLFITSVEAGTEQIQQLIKQGAFAKALVIVEEQLSKNSGEIQVLFLKGLILAKMDRLQEAEAVFIKLTEEYPELPEPYNNLAVIYAATGDYDKAEQALRKAINTHPSYATAHENLGDIYAKMASQAYNNALKLDAENKETKEKLALISNLIPAPEPVTPQAVAATQKSLVPQTGVETSSLAISQTKNTTESDTELARVDPDKTDSTEADSVPVAEPTLVKFDPQPTAIIQPPADKRAASKQVAAAVNKWVNAWSAKDVANYVDSYSDKFVPPDGLNRAQWEAQRQVRLSKPRFIKVTLEEMKVEILSEDMAMVRFTQNYHSDNYQDRVNKRLLMNNSGGEWLISSEESNKIR